MEKMIANWAWKDKQGLHMCTTGQEKGILTLEHPLCAGHSHGYPAKAPNSLCHP